MIQQSLVIEEGVPQDAKAVLSLVTAAAKETDFITGVETIVRGYSSRIVRLFIKKSNLFY